MPRPERPLDPFAGPVQAFAAELRQLRQQAGNPKYLQMARQTGKSRTALAEAAGGDHLPTWETVEAYVMACGAEPGSWRLRWDQVDEQVRPRRQREPVPVVSPVTVPERSPATERRLTILVGVLVTLVVLSVSAAAVTLFARTDDAVQPAAGLATTIVLHSGPQTVEIRSGNGAPVYLSTRPVARCAERGCAIPGTQLLPGEFKVVSCYTGGEVVTDTNPDHHLGNARMKNPDNFRSDGWYGSLLHDGRLAYLSEVYVTPEYRHGLNLPECSRTQPMEAR